MSALLIVRITGIRNYGNRIPKQCRKPALFSAGWPNLPGSALNPRKDAIILTGWTRLSPYCAGMASNSRVVRRRRSFDPRKRGAAFHFRPQSDAATERRAVTPGISKPSSISGPLPGNWCCSRSMWRFWWKVKQRDSRNGRELTAVPGHFVVYFTLSMSSVGFIYSAALTVTPSRLP